MFIDTHCHLNFKSFIDDYRDVIARAKEKKVDKIIIVGAALATSERAISIAQECEGCYATVGVHPHHLDEYLTQGHTNIHTALSKLITHHKNKVKAVGETGLDRYHYKNDPPVDQETVENQKNLLQMHLDIAVAHDLPLVIHCREAFADLIPLLDKQLSQGKFRGVVHCFSGTKDDLKKILAMNLFVGFDGNSSYPENEWLRDLINTTPIEKLLLETDAPYLTPQPHRRTRNEPAYIPLIAQTVAQVKKITMDEVAHQTTANATLLFGI